MPGSKDWQGTDSYNIHQTIDNKPLGDGMESDCRRILILNKLLKWPGAQNDQTQETWFFSTPQVHGILDE
jgi:hypothetical protein